MKTSNRIILLFKAYSIFFFSFFLTISMLLIFPFSNAFAEDMGPALRFTGPDQRVEIDPFPKATGGMLTIEFRLKIENADSGMQSLVGDGEGSFDYCAKVYFNGDDRKLYAFLQTTSDTFMAKSNTTIAPGLWYHVAYVVDGTKLTIYLSLYAFSS